MFGVGTAGLLIYLGLCVAWVIYTVRCADLLNVL